jgi:rhodanese-related sulfurtransferase
MNRKDNNYRSGSFIALLLALALTACTGTPTAVPEIKRTQLGLYLSSSEAYGVAQKERVLFLDVRTRAEVNFLGMPTVADANVPYLEIDRMFSWDEKKGVFKMDPNSDFVSEVQKRLTEKGLTKSDKIILMCRAGDRSAKAVDLLAKAGFSQVYSVVDGYEGDVAKDGPHAGQHVVNGWRNNKLPWSYKLTKQKMYFEE